MEKEIRKITNDRPETELSTHDFYYDLPESLIAQTPAEKRDECRLLVLDRKENQRSHKVFKDVIDYIRPEDMLVVNASKVILTGKKLDQKIYYKHSGYVGGLKETKYRKLMAEKPEEALRHAVVGMLPKGPLGRQMAKKLKIYAGAEHEHAAQKPEVLSL